MSRTLASLTLALACLTPALAGDTYEVDASHSHVGFAITHLKVSRFYGRFNDVAGTFVVDADPAKCSIELTVKAASVDTANKKRDDHLRSQDFFSVEEFETISFKSSAATKKGDKLEVKGTLTLHGVSKEITVEVEHVGTGPGMKGEQRAGYEARFTIKRSDYGMTYLLDGLSDEVRLVVSLEGVKK